MNIETNFYLLKDDQSVKIVSKIYNQYLGNNIGGSICLRIQAFYEMHCISTLPLTLSVVKRTRRCDQLLGGAEIKKDSSSSPKQVVQTNLK